jgi:cytosolic carboxypeptidase protein 2/3
MAVSDPRELIPTYELHMQNDINTKGCTQWYYFSVQNKNRGKVRFRIMNFVSLLLTQYKPTSLYQKGMKVLISNDRV